MTSGIPAEDWIAHHARYAADAEAAHDLASGRRFTYAQFDERITRAALWLGRAFGVARGDRVAVLSMNDTDMLELQFACRRLGAIFLPLNWRLAVPELEFIAKDSAPVVLIHGEEFADAALQVARLAGVPHTAGLANGKPSAYEAGIAAAASAGSGTLDPPALDLGDVWTLMYTSGTTGRPKGAQITYQMCLFNALHCAMSVGLTAASKNLVLLPIFHTGGLNVYANPIFHTGGCNVVMRSFDPGLLLRVLTDRRIGLTHALGVPTNLLMLAQEPGFAEADFSHIVSFGIGGASAPLALLESYARKGIALQQCWGMTETGPIGLMLSGAAALDKIGSSGLPPLYVRLKICDPDGNEVKRGETGELMIRGPHRDAGLLEPAGGQRGGLHPRRLVPHRRRRAAGRGRLLLYRRPLEGHVHLRRRERLSGRGRERDLPARRCSGDGRGRHPAREVGRGRPRLRRAQGGRQPRRGPR